MDEEWARRLVDMGFSLPDPDAEPALTPLHYTPEVAYLAAVVDRIEALRNTLIAVNNEGKAPNLHPLPRPETAFARLAEQRVRDELLEIDAFILGGGPPS